MHQLVGRSPGTMDVAAFALAILVILVLRYYLKIHKTAQLVNRLPGPKGYPLLGNIREMLVSRDRILIEATERYAEYGPLYKTWAGPQAVVHIAGPEYMEPVLSSSVNIAKGITYNFLKPWLGTGLLTSKGEKWFTHRKMITPTFHFKIIDSFIEVFAENSNILVKKLAGRAGGEQFDIYPYITLCALDIICESAMGTKISAQNETQSPYVNSIYSISRLTMKRAIRVWLHPAIIFQNMAIGKEYQRHLNVVHSFTEKVIKEKKLAKKTIPEQEESDIGAKKRKAFLDLLLEASDGSINLSDEELREEVDTFMFEGHDTTTAGMCWTILLLGHHPEIQEKVFEELQAVFADDPSRLATMRDLGEMKLLERVIKESLRMYPSVPYISRLLQEDVKLGEYLIPSGTSAILYIYNMHRRADLFPDPDTFDPDRFLPENIQKRHPYAYVPFSAGPRNCIGQKFALAEEKVILSSILRSYKIKSVDKLEGIKLIGELVLRPGSGINVQITRR